MNTNILDAAVALSDGDLLASIDALAGRERETIAELVAHLAALELRPSAYAARGYGTLFDYCTQALRLSEDAACNRIGAARTCRQFPLALELLAGGSITLTTIRILGPHLTTENHATVLGRAANQKRGQIECLAAELAPRPDVAASVRKLPTGKDSPLWPAVESDLPGGQACEAMAGDSLPVSGDSLPLRVAPSPSYCTIRTAPRTTDGSWTTPHRELGAPSATRPDSDRPIVKAWSPNRYRVQFTMGQAAHDDLRCVQDLLRREIPSGDPGLIFERALGLLRETVQSRKLGRRNKSRSATPTQRTSVVRQPAKVREPQAESHGATSPPSARSVIRRAADGPTRHIPKVVQRAVWWRDRGQCAFVSADGHRCMERGFLELHHLVPFALGGPSTIENIALRCRRHNQYEAEMVFGRHAMDAPSRA